MTSPSANEFVRPSRSDISRDPLPTALNEGTAARVEAIGTEASRAYSTAKNDDTTIDQTDNNEGEDSESDSDSGMKIVIYPSNSSDPHHTGYPVLHIGKPSKSPHKRSLSSDSSDSDTLPQAPPALHFPSLGGSIRRVSSAVSTNPGKKPLRLPPEAERRFIHSSSTIKWTPSLNPKAPADHSNSSKKTVQDLVVKLDQFSASGGGTRNPRPTMENSKTPSGEWTTETPVLPSEIPRLLTNALKDPVQTLPSSHQSTPQSSSFKIAP